MKIYLGSTSQLKYDALQEAITFVKTKSLLTENVKIVQNSVESGVPTTPNNNETFIGARNRAVSLIDDIGDLFIGLESGLIIRENILFEECWCVMVNQDKKVWTGISSAIQIPESIIKDMDNGLSHVESVNIVADRLNLSHKDTWGIYTKNALPRLAGLFEASRNALLAFLDKDI